MKTGRRTSHECPYNYSFLILTNTFSFNKRQPISKPKGLLPVVVLECALDADSRHTLVGLTAF